MECEVKKMSIFKTSIFLPLFKVLTKATHNTCAVNGEGAIAERTAHDLNARLKNGSLNLIDAPRSGHPVEIDEE